MSIWDAFCHTPGKISGNATGDISTCHFYRWDRQGTVDGILTSVLNEMYVGCGCCASQIMWPYRNLQLGGT